MSADDDWTFYLDRALGKHTVAGALREAGARVELHGDHFADDASDVDWLPIVAARGWVILTKDAAIARRPLERLAIVNSGARFFAFNNAQVPGATVAAALVAALPRMRRILATVPAPFTAIVDRQGLVRIKGEPT